MVDVLAVDRVIVLTPALEEAVEQFERLGFDFGDPVEMEVGGEVIASRLDWSGLDLMTPKREGTELSAYLDAEGPGLYGLVLRIDDLDSAKRDLAADGIDPMDEYEVGDVSEALYHPRHFSGVLVTLAEYSPRHPLEEAVE
ncbi:VOC family protein [Natronomonas marina]|uniref:VOC family protein n=1 Tax=Natronomonas marina TaxID=2961939 RepID=UPI0020C9AEF7|nr:VOC family protein [Natronomonas marina]